MTSPLGQTFAPTGSADEELSKKPNAAQQAIQVLSMRLPRVKGARSISPLVGEPGSAARREVGGFSPDSAVLQTLMRAQAPTGTSEAMSAPMGSLPGASSMGASSPMAAAMAALGGGMMNAPAGDGGGAPAPSGPSAPFEAPAPPPPPQIPSGGWTPLPPNVVPAEDAPAPRTNPRSQTPTQDGFMEPAFASSAPQQPSGGGLPSGAQPPIQQPPPRPEYPGANKPGGPFEGQDMTQILGALINALRGRMR